MNETPWAQPLPHACIVIRCGDCKVKYGDEDGGWHFDSPKDAQKAIDDSDWAIQGDEAICPGCVDVRLCMSLGGHAWRRFEGREPFWSCPDCSTSTMSEPEVTRS